MSDIFKVDGATDPWFGFAIPGPVVLTDVHDKLECAGRACVVHSPSDHHMRGWPLIWRADRKLMERTCPHGLGHPDPDDLSWHVDEGRPWMSSHGCDGCCITMPEVTP